MNAFVIIVTFGLCSTIANIITDYTAWWWYCVVVGILPGFIKGMIWLKSEFKKF